jgi:hypothetical protein
MIRIGLVHVVAKVIAAFAYIASVQVEGSSVP